MTGRGADIPYDLKMTVNGCGGRFGMQHAVRHRRGRIRMTDASQVTLLLRLLAEYAAETHIGIVSGIGHGLSQATLEKAGIERGVVLEHPSFRVWR